MKRLFNAIFYPAKHAKYWAGGVIALSLIGNTLIVHITGGIPSAFSHTMYITILIAAIFMGPWFAALTGLIAGILVGPLMSLEFMNGMGEPFINSLYRTLYFMAIGVMIGGLLHYIKSQNTILHEHHTHDLVTGIPNVNHYLEKKREDAGISNAIAMTIQINNHDDLILLIGKDAYSKIHTILYHAICEFMPAGSHVMYVDERHFWIEIATSNYEGLIGSLMACLEQLNLMSGAIPIYIEYSIGVSLSNEVDNMMDRFHESDVAALYAKRHALLYLIYNQAYEQDQRALKLLGELPQAIKDNLLLMMYQPIIDLKENICIGMEALIRWRHHNSILSPGEFIPLAEKTRLINQVSEWVCARVVSDYPTFQKVKDNLQISLNISSRNLYEPALIKTMINQIKHANLPDQAIEIEITESTFMLNKQAAEALLKVFVANKIAVVLDDFGNEYSSLAYLRDLPFKKLKIDRGFTMNITTNKNTRILVRAIIDLAHGMGFKVVAEGIENQDTLSVLMDMGCDYGQGFLYAKPMYLEDCCLWMKENKKQS